MPHPYLPTTTLRYSESNWGLPLTLTIIRHDSIESDWCASQPAQSLRRSFPEWWMRFRWQKRLSRTHQRTIHLARRVGFRRRNFGLCITAVVGLSLSMLPEEPGKCDMSPLLEGGCISLGVRSVFNFCVKGIQYVRLYRAIMLRSISCVYSNSVTGKMCFN